MHLTRVCWRPCIVCCIAQFWNNHVDISAQMLMTGAVIFWSINFRASIRRHHWGPRQFPNLSSPSPFLSYPFFIISNSLPRSGSSNKTNRRVYWNGSGSAVYRLPERCGAPAANTLPVHSEPGKHVVRLLLNKTCTYVEIVCAEDATKTLLLIELRITWPPWRNIGGRSGPPGHI